MKTESLSVYFKCRTGARQVTWCGKGDSNSWMAKVGKSEEAGFNGPYQSVISDIKCYILVYTELVLFQITFKWSTKHQVPTSSA